MGEGAVVVLEAPKPRSPPRYPDMCGRRRLQLEVQILDRELTFLKDELHLLEGAQPVSRSACLKEVNEFVGTKQDPLIPINKRKHRSCRLYWWIRSKLCTCASMAVLLLPMPTNLQKTKLLGLFMLRAKLLMLQPELLQLLQDPFVLQTKLQLLRVLQRGLQPLRRVQAGVWLMFWRRRLLRRLQAELQLLRRAVLQLRGLLLPSMRGGLLQAPEMLVRAVLQLPVVVLQGAAFVLQVPVVVLRQGGLLQQRVVPELPEAVVPGVLLRVRVVVQKLYRRMPMRPVLCQRVPVLRLK